MTEALAETETEIVVEEQQNLTTHPGEDLEDFVTFTIGDQMFGIPVLRVQDILTPDRIAPIPLAPKEVRGSINLRGRIVTVIDVRVRLGLPPPRLQRYSILRLRATLSDYVFSRPPGSSQTTKKSLILFWADFYLALFLDVS